MTTSNVLKQIQTLYPNALLILSTDIQIEDDCISIPNEELSIQVGDGYLVATERLDEESFISSPVFTTIEGLIAYLKKRIDDKAKKRPTFADFVASRRVMTKEEIETQFGYEIYDNKAYIYLTGYSIEINEEDKLLALDINNSCYSGGFEDLGILEQRLWDEFAKFEEFLTEEEIEADKHTRAADFMVAQGWPLLSLDEQDKTTMTPQQIAQVDYLLEQFNK
jgi:hypothetical protein